MPQMDYAGILESYLIPAEEGFLFTQITEENINKLGEKRTLLVFTTDDSLPFGGIDPKKYMQKYKFSQVIEFPIIDYFYSKISDRFSSPTFDQKLKSFLDNSKNVLINELDGGNYNVMQIIESILKACDEYSKNTNTLIIASLSDTTKFSFSCMRDYPIIITHASIIKSVMRGLFSNDSITVKQLRNNYKDFERFNKSIPKYLFIKDMKFDLFHVSPNGNIKELIPKITSKPMRTENIGIARVSAAPSIDACFRAVGIASLDKEKDKKRKYYVYKLRLSKNIRIVKPSSKLVPDQQYTHEYWILDPVPVDLVGTITVSLNEKGDRLVFDTSDMPIDPMITTTFKKS